MFCGVDLVKDNYKNMNTKIMLNKVPKKEEFLLVNLVSFEEKYFAIPGGGIEEGESKEEAVYREIGEELGIEEKSLKLVGKSDTPVQITFKTIKMNREGKEYKGSQRYFFGFTFIGSDDKIFLEEDEVRSYS